MAKKRRATYRDVLDAPEDKVAEIIAGELHLSPRPISAGSRVHSNVHSELTGPFDRGRGGPGGWILFVEPEWHAGRDILIPDIGGWKRERMPELPKRYPTIRPDWVCEVLSKSTERTDRTKKMPRYAALGVPYAWLVHPGHRSVEAYRLHDGKWLQIGVYGEDQRARIEPFHAIVLDLANLWLDTPPPTRAAESWGGYIIEGAY
jgi:hypothetical protein